MGGVRGEEARGLVPHAGDSWATGASDEADQYLDLFAFPIAHNIKLAQEVKTQSLYSRMPLDFFGRCPKEPDQVTALPSVSWLQNDCRIGMVARSPHMTPISPLLSPLVIAPLSPSAPHAHRSMAMSRKVHPIPAGYHIITPDLAIKAAA